MIIAPSRRPETRPVIYPVNNIITRINPVTYWPMMDKGSRLIDTMGLNHLTNVGSVPHPDGRYLDGIDDYAKRMTYDSNQGALSYQGDDTDNAEFRDAGQDFSEWASSGKAGYMLIVTNDDASISWGYMGASDTATDIDIYTDIDLTIRGWKVAAPVAGSKTPSSYVIRRTDLQITSDLSVVAWVKGAAQDLNRIVNRYSGSTNSRSFMLTSGIDDDSKFVVYIAADGAGADLKKYESSITVCDNTWHMAGFTFTNDTLKLYGDGELDPSPTKVIDDTVAALYDTFIPLTVGGWSGGDGFSGCIGDVAIFNRVLSSVEIKHIFQGTAGKYGRG